MNESWDAGRPLSRRKQVAFIVANNPHVDATRDFLLWNVAFYRDQERRFGARADVAFRIWIACLAASVALNVVAVVLG